MQPVKEQLNFKPADVLSCYFLDVQALNILKVFQDDVVLVELGGRRYVVKRYPQNFSSERHLFTTKLQNKINQGLGIKPDVVSTLDGTLCVQIGGYSYDVTEFVENVSFANDEVLDLGNFFYSIGSFVGALHTELSQFNDSGDAVMNALLHIHEPNSPHLQGLLHEYETEGVTPKWIQVLKNKILLSRQYVTAAHSLTDLPQNIVHGDIYMNNILFGEDQKVIGLIDFAHAGKFVTCYEVFRSFIQINKFLNGASINPEHLVNFLKGYLSIGSLEEIELKQMLDLYLYTQASDTSFLDIATIKSGGAKAEYAYFRFQSLMELHKSRDLLNTTVLSVNKKSGRRVQK